MATAAVDRKNKLGPGEKVPLYYDECAKIMFGNPDEMAPLILLLSKVLRIEYDELEGKVQLVSTDKPNKIIGAKKTDRDIVVHIDNEVKNKIIIEINMSLRYYDTIVHKSLYYLNETSGSGLKETENYDEIEPTFLICFNTFFVDNIHKKIFDEYYFRNEEGYILTRKERILQINIAECRNSWYNGTYKALTNVYEKDLVLLGAAMYTNQIDEFNDCIDELSTTNYIKSVIEEVSKEMHEDEELKVRYYDFLEETKRLNDSIISEEKRKSRNEGKIETQKEIVLNMYHEGLKLNVISKCLNLSIQKINSIINDEENN